MLKTMKAKYFGNIMTEKKFDEAGRLSQKSNPYLRKNELYNPYFLILFLRIVN